MVPAAEDEDEDGDRLSFSIRNRPSWAGFNTETGELLGWPRAANAGHYSDIVISVSDGVAETELPALSLTVESSATLSVDAKTQQSYSGGKSNRKASEIWLDWLKDLLGEWFWTVDTHAG